MDLPYTNPGAKLCSQKINQQDLKATFAPKNIAFFFSIFFPTRWMPPILLCSTMGYHVLKTKTFGKCHTLGTLAVHCSYLLPVFKLQKPLEPALTLALV